MSDTSSALAIIPHSGVETYRMSTDAASISKAIVLKTAMSIQGRKYVKVEGWQAIAIAHGCTASSGNVERVDGGFKATGQVRRMDTGAVIAEAEGYVGEDEPTWFGGGPKNLKRRPDYAIRAMAQTRAISRACRSAFAHVVVMMDAGLQTTPAEEVPDGGFDEPRAVTGQNDALALAAAEITEMTGNTESTYRVNKLSKAIACGWEATNKTDKGKEDQIFDYLDMARTSDEIAAILNKNVAFIDASPKKDEINESAMKLLEWFDSQTAKVHAA